MSLSLDKESSENEKIKPDKSIKIEFDKLSVYYRIFHSSELIHNFKTMCDILKNFSDKFGYKDIIGLHLSGEHYDRDISFEDSYKISSDEIKRISQIIPIMDKTDHLPFIIDRDYIEVFTPAREKAFHELIDQNNKKNEFFSSLIDKIQWKKIEMHFRLGRDEELIKKIIQCFFCSEKKLEIVTKGMQTSEVISKDSLSIDQLDSISKFKQPDMVFEVLIQDLPERKVGFSICSYCVNTFNERLEALWRNCIFDQPMALPDWYTDFKYF